MDITTLGEILIDMFPAEIGRRLVEVSAFLPKPGGAPANVAVAARRLGAETAFIGKVGDDVFGHHLIAVLREQGVETRGMRLDDHARTTLAIIAMPDENSAEFVFYRNPGADTRLHPSELDSELLSSTRVLHIGSLSLAEEPSRSATFAAVKLARAAGALISFDVNYRPSLWAGREQAIAQIEAMIPHVHLLKVNEVELALLVGESPSDQAAVLLLARGPALILLTKGRQGSAFYTRSGSGHVPGLLRPHPGRYRLRRCLYRRRAHPTTGWRLAPATYPAPPDRGLTLRQCGRRPYLPHEGRHSRPSHQRPGRGFSQRPRPGGHIS